MGACVGLYVDRDPVRRMTLGMEFLLTVLTVFLIILSFKLFNPLWGAERLLSLSSFMDCCVLAWLEWPYQEGVHCMITSQQKIFFLLK